ncbi:hypothetical protein QC762_300070 [Podospora pseudocomata]|uniref:Uncharacterized protein n=1 Tax=Podospora pseudocomata TaxID=2093779 RepID=A0ABR0GHK4_9PEZI|nr:hypothetical protein QC762_300070 [Podospora pseudocomata]
MSFAPPPYLPPPPKDNPPTISHGALPTEEPPAYSQLESTTFDPNDPMPPATFSVHGRFIYASPSPSTPPSSDPSYQTDYPILTPTHGSRTVNFQRVQYRYRASNATGRPVISHRGKDLYTLSHHLPILGMPFQAMAVPKSRKTLGEVHIAKSPAFHTGYRANRVLPDHEVARLERKGEKVPKEYHFQIKEGGAERWVWKDSNGRAVAFQWRGQRSEFGGGDGQPGSSRDPDGGVGDGGGWGVPRLQVLVELDRRTLDSLVAVWCLWAMHLHHEATAPKKTWEDRLTLMARKRPEGTPQGGFYTMKF